MTDRIVLAGMTFQARHGVEDWEKSEAQRFEVDVELALDVQPAALDDDLAQTVDYVGDSVPRIFNTAGPARISVSGNPTSTAFGRLVALVREAAKPNAQKRSLRIDASMSMDFGDGGRDRWKFPDSKLSSPKTNVSGRNDRVKSSYELLCANPSRM